MNQNVYLLKSFDFKNVEGYLYINKKNIVKKALTKSYLTSKEWTSKYGSITFNQAGRDFPFGGMNEAGVAMEIMWLDETLYPENSKLPTINESQKIQYILDTSANLDEAISQIKTVEIEPILAPVHYMICDSTSKCSIVEYLNRQLVITSIEKDSEKISQNSIYAEMLSKKLRVDGSTFRNSPVEIKSIFDTASLTNQDEIITQSFKNLETVQQGAWTKWQIVYNLSSKEAWFRTTTQEKIKHISLKDYELDCQKEINESVVNLNLDFEGDLKDHLEKYSIEIDDKLLDSFKEIPSIIKKAVHDYSSINHKCEKSSQGIKNE
jgi:choloylglycine hydrolase